MHSPNADYLRANLFAPINTFIDEVESGRFVLGNFETHLS